MFQRAVHIITVLFMLLVNPANKLTDCSIRFVYYRYDPRNTANSWHYSIYKEKEVRMPIFVSLYAQKCMTLVVLLKQYSDNNP